MSNLTELLDRLDRLEKKRRGTKNRMLANSYEWKLNHELSANAIPLIDATREMHKVIKVMRDLNVRDASRDAKLMKQYARETLERVGKMFGDKEKL